MANVHVEFKEDNSGDCRYFMPIMTARIEHYYSLLEKFGHTVEFDHIKVNQISFGDPGGPGAEVRIIYGLKGKSKTDYHTLGPSERRVVFLEKKARLIQIAAIYCK